MTVLLEYERFSDGTYVIKICYTKVPIYRMDDLLDKAEVVTWSPKPHFGVYSSLLYQVIHIGACQRQQ